MEEELSLPLLPSVRNVRDGAGWCLSRINVRFAGEGNTSLQHPGFAAFFIMGNLIVRPRCPNCGRVVAEWLRGASGYTCPRCHLHFALNSTGEGDLTNPAKCANTILVH